MKPHLFTIAATICLSLNIDAKKMNAAAVPSVTKASFAKEFPGITGKWEKEKDNFEVNFKKDGHSMSALFTATGALLETETDIKLSELPKNALAYIRETYPGTKITEAAKITKPGGEVNFEAEVKGVDHIFDAAGKLVKKVKE